MEGSNNKKPIYRRSIFTIGPDGEIVTENDLQRRFYGMLQNEQYNILGSPRTFCWVTGKGLINSTHRGRSKGRVTTVELQAHHIVPVNYVLEMIEKWSTAEEIINYINYIKNRKSGNHIDSNNPFIQKISDIIDKTYSISNGVLISADFHNELHKSCGEDPVEIIQFMRNKCLETYRSFTNQNTKIDPIVVGGVERRKYSIMQYWAKLMASKGLLPVNVDNILQQNGDRLPPVETLRYNPTFFDNLFDNLKELLGQSQSENLSLRRI